MANDPTGLTNGISFTNPFNPSPAGVQPQIRAIGIYIDNVKSFSLNQVSYELAGGDDAITIQEGLAAYSSGSTNCTIEVDGIVTTDGSDGTEYLEQAVIKKTLVSVALRMGGQFRRVDMRVLRYGAKSNTETGMVTESATLAGAVPGFSTDGTKNGTTS